MKILRLIVCVGAFLTVASASAQTVTIDHEKMIQMIRQALAKERCEKCCSNHENMGRMACSVCACVDHSQCQKPLDPAGKQARLEALLADYHADKITPAEYQQQRAKIRAEP